MTPEHSVKYCTKLQAGAHLYKIISHFFMDSKRTVLGKLIISHLHGDYLNRIERNIRMKILHIILGVFSPYCPDTLSCTLSTSDRPHSRYVQFSGLCPSAQPARKLALLPPFWRHEARYFLQALTQVFLQPTFLSLVTPSRYQTLRGIQNESIFRARLPSQMVQLLSAARCTMR